MYNEIISATQTVGFPVAIAVFFAIQSTIQNRISQKQSQKQFEDMQNQQQKNIELIQGQNQRMLETVQAGMKDLVNNISRDGLSCKQCVSVFEVIMKNHITQKIELVEGILIKNDIFNRRCQIERNIRAEFMKITQDEISLMRSLNMTVFAGFLAELDWNLFIGKCAEIIFTTADNKSKLIDLKSYMSSFVTDMIRRYETNFTESLIEE